MLDGRGLDPAEAACVSRSGRLEAMGLTEAEFDRVVLIL